MRSYTVTIFCLYQLWGQLYATPLSADHTVVLQNRMLLIHAIAKLFRLQFLAVVFVMVLKFPCRFGAYTTRCKPKRIIMRLFQ